MEASQTAVVDRDELRDDVIAAIKTVYDPEIPVDVYELGLIYRCDIDAQGRVAIQMTLTAPGCPVAGTLPELVRSTVAEVPGVAMAEIELVWEPPWTMDRMSEAAKFQLGFM